MSDYEQTITEAAARLTSHLSACIDRGDVSALGGAA